ncbi:MAG: hypothetical protein ACRC92_17470 [Peptostreptococcaceae bacterium]
MVYKIEDNDSNNNNFTVEDLEINRENNSELDSENIRIILDVNEGVCDLCKNKSNNIGIHFIDSNKTIDLDSILNLVVLCDPCKKEVNGGIVNFDDKLKEIAFDKIDKVMDFVE